MEVSINHTSEVTAEVTVQVVQADYQEKLDKALRSLRQQAHIPGFREGKVPMSLIEKKYGRGARVEEVNKVVINALYSYIEENKLHVLGDPLWKEGEEEQDWEKDVDFTFVYDLALAPKIEVEFSKKDKLPYYKIEVTEDMINARVSQLRDRMGHNEDVEEVQANDVLRGVLVEREDGETKDGGIRVEEAMLTPRYMANEDECNKFISATLNSVVSFVPSKAFEDNAYELASLLKVDRKEVENYKDVEFGFEIQGISRHIPAELNEAFFSNAFGPESDVKDEKALNEMILKNQEAEFAREGDYKLLIDLRDCIKAKTGELAYPDVLLKRWLQERNPDMTNETVEEEYPKMIEQLTYSLAKSKLAEDHGVKVEPEQVQAFAEMITRSQFAQYGMGQIPDEVVTKYAKEMLEKEEQRQGITDRVLEDNLVVALKPLITLEEKTVSQEEFRSLMEPEKVLE